MKTSAETRRRTRLSPLARRQQLMDCAIRVFARRGIGRAGHAEIAELAQVSVATVFNYFNTREELIQQVLAQVGVFFKDLARQAYQNEASLDQALKRHVTLLVEAIYHQHDYISIWIEWNASLREQIWPGFQQLMEEVIDIASAAVDTGGQRLPGPLSLDDLLWLVNAMTIALAHKANGPTPPRQSALQEVADRWVAALLAKS